MEMMLPFFVASGAHIRSFFSFQFFIDGKRNSICCF